MKKFIVVVCAFFALSAAASAQFMNAGASASKSSGTPMFSGDHPKSFSTFSLTYSPVNMTGKYDGLEVDLFKGFFGSEAGMNALSLNWTNAHNVYAPLPLYLEYGLGVQWGFASGDMSEEGYKSEISANFLSLKVPVSAVFDFAIPTTPISVAPYVGLNLSGYLLGSAKNTYEYTGEGAEYMEDASGEEERSFFSKEDMESAGEPFNRFILGWHIGARIGFNKFFLGIAYEGPLTNFYNKNGLKYYSNQVNISLGLKF